MSISPPTIKAPRFSVCIALEELDRLALHEAVNTYTRELVSATTECCALTIEALLADGRTIDLRRLTDLLRAIKPVKAS